MVIKVKQYISYTLQFLFIIGMIMISTAESYAKDNTKQIALEAGKQFEVSFAASDLPKTLYSMMNNVTEAPCLTVRLPDDYNSANRYPLVVYVPGYDGGAKGNIFNAKAIGGSKGCITATLPLFKKSIDRSEVGGGLIVSLEDYPTISKAYSAMLGRLFEIIPNIDIQKSALVGFSNGAITIGVLVSNHDEFILTHFKSFCIVDQGMFHLTDLHKNLAKDCRYLILVGDKDGMGRDFLIKQAQLLQDSWALLHVNVTCRIMSNTGHEFNEPQMAIVNEWLKNDFTKSTNP